LLATLPVVPPDRLFDVFPAVLPVALLVRLLAGLLVTVSAPLMAAELFIWPSAPIKHRTAPADAMRDSSLYTIFFIAGGFYHSGERKTTGYAALGKENRNGESVSGEGGRRTLLFLRFSPSPRLSFDY
jgi:hypothetical protein